MHSKQQASQLATTPAVPYPLSLYTNATGKMRQLKHHEQRLLKKHDFLNWKSDSNDREVKVMRRYHIQDRDDYHRYNKLLGRIRHLALRLSTLPAQDPFRHAKEESLLAKLYDMGLLTTGAKMTDVLEKLTVSSFARRRLPVVMVGLKMSETVKQVSESKSSAALIAQ